MLHKLNMKKQLLVMGTVTTLLFIPAGIYSVLTISSLAKTVKEDGQVHVPLTRNLAMADMMHDGIRAVVLEATLARMSENDARIDELGKEIDEKVSDMNKYINEIGQLALPSDSLKMISEAQADVQKYGQSAKKTWNTTKEGSKAEQDLALTEFNKHFEIVEVKLETVGENLEKFSTDSMKIAEAEATSEAQSIKIIVLASLLLSASISFVLSRASTGRLKASIGELQKLMKSLHSSAHQVGADSAVVSDSTMQLGTAIEQTVASMTEMTAMLAQTAESAGSCFKASEQGKEEAVKGQEVVERLLESVQTIESSQVELSEMMELMKEISAKTQIINEIVSETRLLSFNASIEAARAGVHGRGFAVVAEEVGKLAVISGKASQDIRALLEHSTKKVEKVVTVTKERVAAGVVSSHECHRAIDSMRQSLNRISDSVQSISHATKEQKTGVQQVNLAVLEIERVNAKNSTAAESLAHQADTLRGKVDGSANQVHSIAEFAGALSQSQNQDGQNGTGGQGGGFGFAGSSQSLKAGFLPKNNASASGTSTSSAPTDANREMGAENSRGSRSDTRFDEVA